MTHVLSILDCDYNQSYFVRLSEPFQTHLGRPPPVNWLSFAHPTADFSHDISAIIPPLSLCQSHIHRLFFCISYHTIH